MLHDKFLALKGNNLNIIFGTPERQVFIFCFLHVNELSLSEVIQESYY